MHLAREKDFVAHDRRAKLRSVSRQDVGRRSCSRRGDMNQPQVAFEHPACRTLRRGKDKQPIASRERRRSVCVGQGATGRRNSRREQAHWTIQSRGRADSRLAGIQQIVVDADVSLKAGQSVSLAEGISPLHLQAEGGPASPLRVCKLAPGLGVVAEPGTHLRLRGRVRVDRYRPVAGVLAVSITAVSGRGDRAGHRDV